MAVLRSLLVVAVALIRTTSASCALDNCYRNLAHNSASDFCSTYTTTVNTATTGLPTYIPTSCYTRLSSACSCVYPGSMSITSGPATITASTTVTITQVSTTTVTSIQPTCILRNGDFGLDPWENEDIINESSYGYNAPQVASPGYLSTSAVYAASLCSCGS